MCVLCTCNIIIFISYRSSCLSFLIVPCNNTLYYLLSVQTQTHTRTQVRKEREDYHIAHIKVQMSRLEDALAAETKRRVDATTSLDELSRTQVLEMEERVRGN